MEELTLGHEGWPQTRLLARQVLTGLGLSQSFVMRVVHHNLHLKCLKSRRVQELREVNGHTFIVPDMWLSISRDLNPVDCKVLGMIQQRVFQAEVHDVKDLRQRLTDAWAGQVTGTAALVVNNKLFFVF